MKQRVIKEAEGTYKLEKHPYINAIIAVGNEIIHEKGLTYNNQFVDGNQDPFIANVLRFTAYNYQTHNGGHHQWCSNGYDKHGGWCDEITDPRKELAGLNAMVEFLTTDPVGQYSSGIVVLENLRRVPDYYCNTCDHCEGRGQTHCYSCDGDGQAEDESECENCNGTGDEDCENCYGDGDVDRYEPGPMGGLDKPYYAIADKWLDLLEARAKAWANNTEFNGALGETFHPKEESNLEISKTEKETTLKPELKLYHENAFASLARARQVARRNNMDWDAIEKQAKSGAHNNLMATLFEHFEVV